MMSFEFFGIVVYLILQLMIGQWASSRVKTEEDYFLAGRNLTLPLATFSIFATWFGAENCIGSAGANFKMGLSGSRIDPLGYTFCLFAFAFLMAGKLREKNYMTLADLFRSRYSRVVEKVAVIILIPSSLIWAAAQIRAFGQILALTTGQSIEAGIFLATIIVVFYTFKGGLLADVLTDLVQSLVLIVGLFALLYFLMESQGGLLPFFQQIPSEKLSFNLTQENMLSQFELWSIPILGSLTSQEIVSKALASQDKKTAVRSSYLAGCLYLFIGSIPVLLGLGGHSFVSSSVEGDAFLFTLAQQALPRLFFVIFSGAMISAILSTIDSNLLTVSALCSHNLLGDLLPKMSEKKKLQMARMIILLSGMFALTAALYSTRIRELVELASSFGTSGLLVVTIMGLWSKRGNELAAMSTLLIGLLSYLVFEHLFHVQAPFLFSCIASVVTYFLVSLSKRQNI